MSLPWGSFLNQKDVRETNTAAAGSIKTSDTTNFDVTNVPSSNTTIGTVSVTVETGQKVLILAEGLFAAGTIDESMSFSILRGASLIRFINLVTGGGHSGDKTWEVPSMHFLDTTPGTGTITYNLQGNSSDDTGDILYSNFTAIVL